MKRTWVTIKEITGSKKSSGSFIPKRLVANDLELFDKKTIAENFNKFFSEIGPKLASKKNLDKMRFLLMLSNISHH